MMNSAVKFIQVNNFRMQICLHIYLEDCSVNDIGIDAYLYILQ